MRNIINKKGRLDDKLKQIAKPKKVFNVKRALAFGAIDEKPVDNRMIIDMLKFNLEKEQKNNEDEVPHTETTGAIGTED